MSARKAIFARLKRTLDEVHNPTVRISGADQRIREANANIIPARGQTEGPARAAMFVSEAEAADAEVMRLAALADVPRFVHDILIQAGASQIKAAPHPQLQDLDWTGVGIHYGRGENSDHIGLSVALAGVAETGTLVLASGPQSPTTLNFLPDVHVVVLEEENIAANYEAVWATLRAQKTEGPVMPRTVNWITGPSRTADIEQTLLLGAHGPRKLIILLIDGKNP
ncbi:MAG: LUD domain-containing protein [Magnetovibrio sp.]|nr:LUD domain-containing protein [Magnetovibrio sp.]